MKPHTIPILNSEYSVAVFIGTREECIKNARKYVGDKELEFTGRGHAFFREGHHPVIIVDSDMEPHDVIATLAHEASHAIQFIEDYVGITDTSGEFRGYGIGRILRTVCKDLFKTLLK